MSSRLAALLLVALLPLACSEEARAAREIEGLDAVAAMTRSVELQQQAMDAFGSVEDEPSAQAAAERLDLLAYQMELIAARLRVTGPPTLEQRAAVIGDKLGGLASGGLATIGKGLKLLGQPKLLAIIDAPQKRFSAASDDVTAALDGR